MKITICGSMAFAKQMLEAEKKLQAMGHTCYLPEGTQEYAAGTRKKIGGLEGAKRKIALDLIKRHYLLIKKSDAILIINETKNRALYYIGGNAFLEMGFAHVLDKKIFVLNPLPTNEAIRQELEAMRPIVLNGNLSQIT
jgi:hypothetical protein